jgi:hypothetical protein
MVDSGRIPPPAARRFVPTLTEVVVLPEQSAPAVSPSPDTASPITMEMLEQIVDASVQRAEAALTQKLPEILSVILYEHALAVSERLRREIKATVRESVTAALADAVPSGALSGGVTDSSQGMTTDRSG